MLLNRWLANQHGRSFRPASQRTLAATRLTFRPRLEGLEDRQVPSVLPVTNSLDDVNQRGSLRHAVANAQDGDTILLTGAVAQTGITLTQGDLLLNRQNLTIRSAAVPIPVTISGGNHSRIFEVASGASVTLSNLIVTGGNGRTGNPPDTNPPDPHEGRGGGIVVDEGAALTIIGCTVTMNFAERGGGIADFGTLTVAGCTVSDNQAMPPDPKIPASNYGGGISVFSGAPFSPLFTATLTISDSTVSGNTALQNGGGIANVSSTVTMNNCDVTGNSAYVFDGGGLNNHLGTFTVINSRVAGNSAAHGFGGGLINYRGTLSISGNSVVDGNTARFGGGIDNSGTLSILGSRVSNNSVPSWNGGGIYNEYLGTAILTNDVMTGNTAEYGGGIFSYGTLIVDGCTLSGNIAQSYGEGGAIFSSGTLTVKNHSVLSYNSGYEGGAIESYGTTDISDSTFDHNSAELGGGGLIFWGGTLAISGSVITNNTASWGGGVDVEYGSAVLTGCSLTGNSAGEGGGIANWDTLTLSRCTLSGNTAGSGGAVYNAYLMAMDGCTVTGNTAVRGGGIYNNRYFGATLTVSKSTVIDNGPDNIAGGYVDNGGNTIM